MVAGIPGTGVGGFFYLLSALVMPFHELFVLLRGKSNIHRWRTIFIQTSLALGVILGIWLTGWGLGFLSHAMVSGQEPGIAGRPVSVIRAVAVSCSLFTLALVILGTLFLSLFSRSPKTASPKKNFIPKQYN